MNSFNPIFANYYSPVRIEHADQGNEMIPAIVLARVSSVVQPPLQAKRPAESSFDNELAPKRKRSPDLGNRTVVLKRMVGDDWVHEQRIVTVLKKTAENVFRCVVCSDPVCEQPRNCDHPKKYRTIKGNRFIHTDPADRPTSSNTLASSNPLDLDTEDAAEALMNLAKNSEKISDFIDENTDLLNTTTETPISHAPPLRKPRPPRKRNKTTYKKSDVLNRGIFEYRAVNGTSQRVIVQLSKSKNPNNKELYRAYGCNNKICPPEPLCRHGRAYYRLSRNQLIPTSESKSLD